MRAKFGGDPTAGSKNLPFKFNNRCGGFYTSRSGFSLFSICSSVIHPVLKQVCHSGKIISHMFMNRAINISLNASVCGTCGARTTHIRSQRARVSSVGKTSVI